MEQSYASAAKSLISKYKRASFDKIEKDELNSKLADLAQEQESYRITNGIDNKIQMNNGGPFDYSTYNKVIDINNSMKGVSYDPNSQGTISEYKTSIAPSLISAGVSTIGNLWLADRARKNIPQASLPRLTAENVSFAPEREAALRERDLTRSSVGRNTRDAARTRGEYLSNMGAAESSINRGVSDVLGQSYQREALANAQERARVNAANAQIGSQQEMFNVGARNQSLTDHNAYLSAAMQGIPMLAKDISAIKQQDALINSLGEDYGIYLQKKPGERKEIIRKYKGGK